MRITNTNPSDTNGLTHRRVIIKTDSGEEVARFEIPGYPKDLAAYMDKHRHTPYGKRYHQAVKVCRGIEARMEKVQRAEPVRPRVFILGAPPYQAS